MSSRDVVRGSAQKRSQSKEIDPPLMSEVRILLLGKSASESSRVGNSILGRSALDSEAPPDVVERVGGRVKDRHVTLINSPHLLNPDISEHQITQTLRECVSLSDPGPHVIVLILNPPCSAGDGERLEQLRHSLSDGLFQHSLVISTREHTHTDEVLQEILQRCSHRHFSLQNDSSPEEILKMCDEIQRSNGGQHLECHSREITIQQQDIGGGCLTSKTREEEFREREERYKAQLKEKEEREEQMCEEMKREREEQEKQKLEEKTRREEEDEKRRETEQRLKQERERWEKEKEDLQSKHEEEENKMKILMEEMISVREQEMKILMDRVRKREEDVKKHEEEIERMKRAIKEERQYQEKQRKRREEEFREREERYKRLIKEREERESKMLEDMKQERIEWEKQKSELHKKQPVQEMKSSVSDESYTPTSEVWRLARQIPDSRGNTQTKASLFSRRIVLLGKSGVGKSAAGNTILGQREFRSVMSMRSVTRVCSEAQTTVSGRSVSVVDTPGFFNTQMTPEESAKEMARSVYLSSPGPHAFLIVFPLNVRFTEREQQIPQQIEMLFGQELLKYSIILFTHGDLLEDQSVEEIIEENSGLRALVDQCGGRYHVFNNRAVNNRDQVNELLQKIDSMIEENGGGHYSNQMFEDAQKVKAQRESVCVCS